MYLYSFSRFAGCDRVFRVSEELQNYSKDAHLPSCSSKKSSKMKCGDLLQLGSEYFLCLGNHLSFEELYLKAEPLKSSNMSMCYRGFLGKKTIDLFHRMVETYYTTYKSVIKHFLSDDIEKVLEREVLLKNKTGKGTTTPALALGEFVCSPTGQTLIVFPDLWTLSHQSFYDTASAQGAILLASQTDKQKDLHRWAIKKGMLSVVVCTYAEIFQDFQDLKKIIWVDPHKRYYANQQDPRYKVGEVLKKMAELRGAELEVSGV